MTTETDGLVLREISTVNNRRVLVLLTRQYGKVSAGTSISPGSRKKSNLAVQPLTHGNYTLYRGKNMFNVDSADTIESFYALGEDPDRYFAASYALEFADRMLPDDQPASQMLDLLLDFFRTLSVRRKRPESLLLIFLWKALEQAGVYPVVHRCARCGEDHDPVGLSIADGGLLCSDCKKSGGVNIRLLYDLKFDIIPILKFIESSRIDRFTSLTFRNDVQEYLWKLWREYTSYHLGIHSLKSESFLHFSDEL